MHEQIKVVAEKRGLEFELELFEDDSDDPDEAEDGLKWLGCLVVDDELSLTIEGRNERIDVQLCTTTSGRCLQISTVAEIEAFLDRLPRPK